MISNLYNYLISNRYIGHTTALKKGIENYDQPFFVLSNTLKDASNITKTVDNKNAIPLSLKQLGGTAGKNFPVLIDNYAIISEIENLLLEHKKVVDELIKENSNQSKKYYENEKFLEKRISKIYTESLGLKQQNKKILNRYIKNRERISPTLTNLSNLSLWDRMFNYKQKVKDISDEYLY